MTGKANGKSKPSPRHPQRGPTRHGNTPQRKAGRNSAKTQPARLERPTPAQSITFLEAIKQAMYEEMERDPAVVVIGEDVGVYGGAFKTSEGLLERIRLGARHRHARSAKAPSSARPAA